MRTIILLLLTLAPAFGAFPQSSGEFSLKLKEITFSGLPAVHSFASAIDRQGRWVIIGGRTDGLHKRRPFEAFLDAGNNKNIYVIDVARKEVWSAPLSSLDSSVSEQLQSTNMEFVQHDDTLYLFGGYGFSARAGDHITYPNICAIEVSALSNAIVQGNPVAPYIHQQEDPRFQVTGGYAGFLEGLYYLVGGQKFMGRYNPMGPGHGPGFIQEYSNAIKRFRLAFDGNQIVVSQYWEEIDTLHLHRRDYNMVPQIFADGRQGFTAFTGVFRYDADLPWLNSVDINDTGYTVRNDYSQLLNQYHTAHLPLYDRNGNVMHTLFFGGIGQYAYDTASGELINDENVPFVKTISRMTRYANDSVAESVMPDAMPGYLGAGAEFFEHPGAPYIDGEILDLNALQSDSQLVGYIFGGIESTVPNSFFSNTNGLSFASNRIFEVSIARDPGTGLAWQRIHESALLNFEIFPNPAENETIIRFFALKEMHPFLYIYDNSGKMIKGFDFGLLSPGTYTHTISLQGYAAGNYLLKMSNGRFEKTKQLIMN